MLYTILPSVREGVLAKIRRDFACNWLELNSCVAHSFSLVGNYASYKTKTHRIYCFVLKLA